MAANCQWTFLLKKAISVIYLLEIGLTFRGKSLKIVLTEGWQSGNAPDSKSGEPANTGAQVQILYLPYIPTVRHDLGRVFFVVFFNLNYFLTPPKDYFYGEILNSHFTQKINQ